ncbi:MAG: hypothetical protein COB85_05055 [Bacteroidetes bacterium]|nr:MAG: hypothetical protein COB85_05055 [Bacteroidota bacterium]
MTKKANKHKLVIAAGQNTRGQTYWLNKLSGDFTKAVFPYDIAANIKKKQVVHTLKFKFPRNLFLSLTRLSNRSDTRLHIILISGLIVLINKYTQNRDLTLGTSIYKQDVEGDFSNTVLPLRHQLEDDLTFRKLLLIVKGTLTEAMENQSYPVELLVDQLSLSGHDPYFPLFDISVLLENIQDPKYLENTEHNMAFSFLKTTGYIEGTVNYNSLLYEKPTIKRIIAHFKSILISALKDVEMKVLHINILSEKEKSLLTDDFNKKAVGRLNDKTIVQLFEAQAKKTPKRIAVVHKDQSLTYAQLNSRSNRVAHYLKVKYSTQADDLIGLLMDRSEKMIIVLLGILKSGAAYVPINADYPKERIHFILNDVHPKCLILDSKSSIKYPNLENYATISLTKDNNEITNSKDHNPRITNRSSDLAYVMYTSGSSGTPKGVMIENKGVVRLVKNMNYVNIDKEDKLLQTGSLAFDASTFEIWGCLLNGASLHLADQKQLLNREMFKKLLIDEEISILWLTASWFNQLVEIDITQFAKLKKLLVGGERLSPFHINKLKKAYPQLEIINGYGPTENTTFTACYKIELQHVDNVPIGKPISNSQVYILDRSLRPVPLGAKGKIYAAGKGLARGYLNCPELTKEKFINGYYFMDVERMYDTGDMGRWLPDGNIEFLGREDAQVKIRGHRIELGEIEHALLKKNGVKAAVVTVRGGNGANMEIVAYIVSDQVIEPKKLNNQLRKVLPDYMIPAYLVQIEKLPLTPNGKIHIQGLPEPKETGTDIVAKHLQPRDELEVKLVGLWSEILNVARSKIGIDTNFFEIGGHSLRTSLLISKIQQEFSAKIDFEEVFSAPTISGLSTVIRKSKKDKYVFIQSAEKREYYELSPAQRRLFLLQQMDLKTTAYNLPSTVLLEGKLDKKILEATFNKLIHRHESLRTSFVLLNGRPFQKIQKDAVVEVVHFKSTEKEVESVIKSFVKPFDLSKVPVLRIGLINIGANRHLLITDLHHIISDGLSDKVLLNEFMEIYEGEKLRPLKIQYRDYSEWMNSEEQIKRRNEQETYWLKQFDREVPILQLPTDYTKPAIQNFDGDAVTFTLSRRETKILEDIAAKQKATSFMVLLSVYYIFLSKISAQEDILVGTPVEGRRQLELQCLIGMFVNTLVMRNHPLKEMTFISFLNEVKTSTLKALENQDYQFEELVKKVVVGSDISQNPLFNVMFTLKEAEPDFKETSALKLSLYKSASQVSKFDLSLDVIVEKEQLSLSFEYVAKLFKKDTIKRFTKYFKAIVTNITENPNNKLGRIEIIPEEEKRQILFEFNKTKAPYPHNKTIYELFEKQAAQTPDFTAIIYKNKFLTYRELNERANQLARILRQKDVVADTIVALVMERSPEMVIAMLGTLKAAAAYLLIDPQYPEHRKTYMLKDSKAKVILTQKLFVETLKEQNNDSLKNEILLVDDEKLYSGNAQNLEPVSTAQSLVYLVYTSGTSGKPKGVMIEHRNLNVYLSAFDDIFHVKSTDITLQLTSVSFDLLAEQVFSILLKGGKLVVPFEEEVEDMEKLHKLINRCGVTIVSCPPLLLDGLNKLPRSPSVHTFINGGDVLKREHISSLLKYAKVYNGYGPAEATIGASHFRCDKNSGPNISIGPVMNNYKIYILDSSNNLVPIGLPGELCISGKAIARGYIGKRKLTAEKFVKSPFDSMEKMYKTGDCARWLRDGNMEFLGRLDDQVKIRGHRIELAEIENHLLKHSAIRAAVVLAREDDKDKQKYLCAYVVASQEFQRNELKNYLSENLPQYMIPSFFVSLKKLPLTSAGKIDSKSLPDLKSLQLTGKVKYMPPQNPMEKKLVKIWKEVLDIEKIGITDNFFDMGGHSLMATQVVSKIHKVLEVKIELKTIFIHPTIQELVKTIALEEKSAQDSIMPVKQQDSYPLSHVQKRFWILDQLAQSPEAYNMINACLLEKKINKKLFGKALDTLVNRHESLRTLFVTIKGEPRQKILPADKAGFKLESIDLRREPKNEKKARDIANLEASTPFNLADGPLLRAKLIQLTDEKYVFIFNMHHIISDGSSLGVFIKDVMTLYAAYLQHKENPLQKLSIQYKDYSAWQNQELKAVSMNKHRQYWIDHLNGKLPVLELPTDKPRPAIQTFNGNWIQFSVEKSISLDLQKLCKRHDVTLFMVLLSVVKTLLYRYSGQADIIIGSPSAIRTHSDTENQIGCYLNTIILRTRFRPDDTFAQLLSKVKETTLNAYEHQEYPFDLLVNELDLDKDLSRNPLFNVMVVLNNTRGEREEVETMRKLGVKGFPIDYVISKLDINLNFGENGEQVFGVLEYNTDLFNRGSIKILCEDLITILRQVTQDDKIQINDIRLDGSLQVVSSLELTEEEFNF